jgi:hypothetical protein
MEIYSIIIVGFVCTLIPTLITLWLNEKVKGSVKSSFDAKLEIIKKEHLLEISKFQTELNHLKLRENFKFTKLHEKRFDVLERTYMYINETSESLKSYVSPVEHILKGNRSVEADEFLKEEFIKIIDEFTLYFKHNCIYFDEELENLLQGFFTESILIFATYFKEGVADDNLFSIKELNKKLLPIKKQIEIKFRELLGE